ncbi:MAG: hypothetical protein V1904_01895 [Bacteroidota bacterium]
MLQDENKASLESILSKVTLLETRIIHIEEKLGIKTGSSEIVISEESEDVLQNKKPDAQFGYEYRIGGYGLSLLGNIVFLFGIIFFSNYIQDIGYPFMSGIFGYSCVAGIILLSRFVKKRIPYLSVMFNMVALVMLYYVTLRLHFFSSHPVIENFPVSLILILFVLTFQVYQAIRKKLELYAATALILALATGVISNSTHVMFGSTVLVSAITVLLFFKYNWRQTLSLSVFLVYMIYILWFLRNPLIPFADSHVPEHHFCHFYLFSCAAVFSLICLVRFREKLSESYMMIVLLLNGILFSGILLIFIPSFFPENFTSLFIVISLFCMVYSILMKFFSDWKFAKAFYAMYGFVAISISVYGIFKLPYTFLLLAIQSLYVITIGIWFRSKLMMSMNTFLFLSLLFGYFFTSDLRDTINFSFVAAAFISSAIIEWRKKYLEIETNLLSNIYLVTAFFTILFFLFKSIPAQYISLSWTALAIIYFLYSLLFHKVRYRWMAIFTMIAAALYLFLVDLSRISLVYRVVAFLFLAVISITISLYYSRPKKAMDEKKDSQEKEN